MLDDGHVSSEDMPEAIIELSEDIMSDDMQSIDDDIIDVSIIELEVDWASEGTVAEAIAPATRRTPATSISFFILDLREWILPARP